jgi:UDP-glucose 4-epimerase
VKVAVTGGAGFIGQHLVKKLVQRNDVSEVVVLDNLSVGKRENVAQDAILRWCDIRDKDDLLENLAGVDVVFHQAAFVTIRGSFSRLRYDLHVNDLGTLNVLESARDSHVSKVVVASSMAVYGQPRSLPVRETDCSMPISPYGFSKLKGEFYCELFRRMYGLKTVALRYFNTYGAGQTLSDYVGVLSIFINQAIKGQPLTIYGDGRQTRDFVHVDDVADANILAGFGDAEGTFNIASGKEISINEIAEWVMRETSCPEKVHLASPPGEINRIVADISKAKRELGFEPRGELRNTLSELIDWWKGRQNVC